MPAQATISPVSTGDIHLRNALYAVGAALVERLSATRSAAGVYVPAVFDFQRQWNESRGALMNLLVEMGAWQSIEASVAAGNVEAQLLALVTSSGLDPDGDYGQRTSAALFLLVGVVFGGPPVPINPSTFPEWRASHGVPLSAILQDMSSNPEVVPQPQVVLTQPAEIPTPPVAPPPTPSPANGDGSLFTFEDHSVVTKPGRIGSNTALYALGFAVLVGGGLSWYAFRQRGF